MSVLLTEGNNLCRVIGWGVGLASGLVVSLGESDA